MKFAHVNIEDVVDEIKNRIKDLTSAIASAVRVNDRGVSGETSMRRLELQTLLTWIETEEQVRLADYASKMGMPMPILEETLNLDEQPENADWIKG